MYLPKENNYEKKLPIGIEDFKEIIEKDCYYVDKTLFIKELLDNSSKVRLFTRPRRFGKHWLSACFGIILKRNYSGRKGRV